MLRSYDPQIGRFLQNDPYDQFASGYLGMGNDPGNIVDPSGGYFIPSNLSQLAAFAVSDLTNVTVIGSLAKVGAKAKNASSLLKITTAINDFKQVLSSQLWNLSGGGAAVLDNATGGLINLRSAMAPDAATNPIAASAFESGEYGGDLLCVGLAVAEGGIGESMMAAGGTLTATVVGAEVGIPLAGTGAIMTAHSYIFFGRAVYNLSNGQVQQVQEKYEEIKVESENKIPREELDPPKKPGNAPTFKRDGKPVEIHHEGQNPNGPFKEMHPNDHRGKGNDKLNHPNKGKPSKVDRKKFKKQKELYWKNEYPEGQSI